jgi:hypothetical protein
MSDDRDGLTPDPQQPTAWVPPEQPSPYGPGPYPGGSYPGGPYPGGAPYGWQQPQAPKPGVIPLRPLGVGDILDGAVTTIRRYPKVILGIAAIVASVVELLNLGVGLLMLPNLDAFTELAEREDPPSFDEFAALLGPLLGSAAVGGVLAGLASVFLTGFLTVAVWRAVLGQPIGFGDVWAQVRPRLLPLLGLTVVYFLIVLGGSLLCVVPGIWLGVLFALATPALVLEPQPIGKALGRSKTLVSGSWWRVFGVLLLVAILTGIVSSLIQAPFSFAGPGGLLSGGDPSVSAWQLVPSAVGAIVAGALARSFSATVTVLLYLDQRMRREGLDIELAQQAGIPRDV